MTVNIFWGMNNPNSVYERDESSVTFKAEADKRYFSDLQYSAPPSLAKLPVQFNEVGLRFLIVSPHNGLN